MTNPPLAAASRSPQTEENSPVAHLDAGGEGSGFENQSVTRVGQILALFGPPTTELSAGDIAERLELNRTTAYRYCASLVTAGILERGRRRGTFILGGLMLELGIHALDRKRVLDIAPPYLRALSTTAGATAVLSLWGAQGPIVALVEEDRRTVLVTVRPGAHLGMTSAQMHVFLAHHRDPFTVERILGSLPTAERTDVEAAVYAARRTGYAISRFRQSLFGLAVPVFDDYGVNATIALLGSDQSTDLTPSSPVLAALQRTATAIGDELGRGEGESVVRSS